MSPDDTGPSLQPDSDKGKKQAHVDDDDNTQDQEPIHSKHLKELKEKCLWKGKGKSQAGANQHKVTKKALLEDVEKFKVHHSVH